MTTQQAASALHERPSPSEALRAGWIDLSLGEEGLLGCCPGCMEAHDERERVLNAPYVAAEKAAEPEPKPSTLFPL